MAFAILGDPEANILANLKPEEFTRVRQHVVDLILATDMSQHGSLMAKWNGYVDAGLDVTDDAQLVTMMQILLKCCDVSNEVRPTEVSDPWVSLLLEEFFAQSDLEKELGLPFLPFMDRDKVTKSGAQVGFIKFVLIPGFESLARQFPQLGKYCERRVPLSPRCSRQLPAMLPARLLFGHV